MHIQRALVLRSASILAALSVFALGANAQQFPVCPVPGSNGPDVIVGDLNGVQNYPASAGLDAIALGTTSCNIGNVWLNWFASTNQHPVIGGGVFKYKVVDGAGRFEQLGQSWLKHGFFALSDNLCCSNCSATDGTHLGVGCSDPYTAGRNGDQGGLGPKWQVNANTGAYTYPPPHPVGGNNGRIQMDQTRLENSSANLRYFGEMQYVTPDDSAANNNDNNTSYRELSYNGSTFAFIGGTQRMKAGIEAWKAIDPAVNQQTVIVPEGSSSPFDGNAKLILSSRATDIGNGMWHYEYALYNQNSDRGVRSSQVPVPATAGVINVGFNDVAYLGGDGIGNLNFDGTDWGWTNSGGFLKWEALQSFAQNPSTNALRWGSTYTFRFDANVAPTSGTATLGQFKVVNSVAVTNVDVPGNGSGGSVLATFCRGDGSGGACPCGNNGIANHGCANSVWGDGGLLTATGTASVSADTVVLNSSFLSGASCVFFLGDAQAGPVVVDDGLGCVSGSIVRLGTKPVGGAASSFPQPGDPSIAVRAAIPAGGGTRYIQCFYRNAVGAFCPPATSNRTNGVIAVYAP
ncbi:MAG: hypothetical protein IPJ77_04170 [Planctomycetes bacterium]|nr:hypothetical protein [Planctomycetota bacterium]